MTTEDDPKWRIFCVARIKPVGEGEAAAVVQESATQLSVPHPDDDDEEPTEGRLTFTMDAICGPEATQQDVYALFKPIVASTCKGRNGCVFAYGQTGSGKTHTVVGGDDFRSRGLVPRAIGQVFREAAKRRRKGGDVSVSCTFAQVYDDALYDLLDESNESDDVGEWTKASVLEGDDGSLTFEGLAEYGADEEEDALRLLWVGTARRVLGQTKANDASSRSHAVFTIYVVDAQRKTRAKLHLVDLAGSERFGAWSDGRRGTRARRARLQRRRSRPRFRPTFRRAMLPRSALGCSFRHARARNTHVEATLNHPFPAQATAARPLSRGTST
jgi:kinesin family protein 6/9